jgi:hypothetical protein
MQVIKNYPAPRWVNVLFNIEKYKFHSSIYIDYPLDYKGQMTSNYFIKWCNSTSKNNPTIFIKMSSNLQDIYTIMASIFNTISHISLSKNHCVSRKMQIRYAQTGFPITIKTKCYQHSCNNFVPITTNYPKFIHKQTHTNYNQRQIFCLDCKKKLFHNQSTNTQTYNLIQEFSNMIIDSHESPMTID